ncbi:unnamed protein product, partial [Amoebophrya sp. A25]|eukprot:GSA25T00019284001.1
MVFLSNRDSLKDHELHTQRNSAVSLIGGATLLGNNYIHFAEATSAASCCPFNDITFNIPGRSFGNSYFAQVVSEWTNITGATTVNTPVAARSGS